MREIFITTLTGDLITVVWPLDVRSNQLKRHRRSPWQGTFSWERRPDLCHRQSTVFWKSSTRKEDAPKLRLGCNGDWVRKNGPRVNNKLHSGVTYEYAFWRRSLLHKDLEDPLRLANTKLNFSLKRLLIKITFLTLLTRPCGVFMRYGTDHDEEFCLCSTIHQ